MLGETWASLNCNGNKICLDHFIHIKRNNGWSRSAPSRKTGVSSYILGGWTGPPPPMTIFSKVSVLGKVF